MDEPGHERLWLGRHTVVAIFSFLYGHITISSFDDITPKDDSFMPNYTGFLFSELRHDNSRSLPSSQILTNDGLSSLAN